MLCLYFVSLVIGLPSVILSALHASMYGFSLYSTVLIIFLFINLFICVWELALYYCFDDLLKEHRRRESIGFYKGDAAGKKLRQDLPLILFRDYKIEEYLKFNFWVHIWTEYCRFDDAYADPQTFQYNIDVGNGHSTPIPCLIVLLSFFFPIFSPAVTGIIGIITFYQKFYGVVLYLFVYHNCHKREHHHLTTMEYVLAVLSTNGVWFICPLLGLWACIQLVLTNSFAFIH